MRQLTPYRAAHGYAVMRSPVRYRTGSGVGCLPCLGLGLAGLGDMSPAEKQASAIAGATLSSAGAVAGALAASATAAGATTGLGAAIAASGIVPFIGPIIAGAMLAITVLLGRGCGETCVVTSEWANQAEDTIKQAVQAYFALPAPRTQAAQNAVLGVIDAAWQGLVQRCSQAGLGTAGQNCIADRQAGACKWLQTTTSPLLSYPGEPQPGQCWNWFNGYRDIVANDQTVAADISLDSGTSTSTSASTSTSTSASSGGTTSLDSKSLAYLGLGAIALVLVMGDN